MDGIPFTGDVAQCKTPVALIPFQFRDGAAWYVMDEAGENRKINANGKGWLAFSSGGVLFVKKFPDLAPGEKLDWTVRWYLLPQPGPDVPSAELLKLALGGA